MKVYLKGVLITIVLSLIMVVSAYAVNQYITWSDLYFGNTQDWASVENAFGVPDDLNTGCVGTVDHGWFCNRKFYVDDVIAAGGVSWGIWCSTADYGPWSALYLVYTDDTLSPALYVQGDPCMNTGGNYRSGYYNNTKPVKGFLFTQGTSNSGEFNSIQIDAIKLDGVIGATATPDVTATPTVIPMLTPTPTSTPCPLIDTGQNIDPAPIENILIYNNGDIELIGEFAYDVMLNFAGYEDCFYDCDPYVPCDLDGEYRYPGESFWCYGEAGACETGVFESRAFYCPGEYELPSFEATGAEGSGVTFSDAGEACFSWELTGFDLSENELLTIIADTFELTVPEWGWLTSTMTLCFQKGNIENLEIGGYDFTAFVGLLLGMLVMIIMGWMIRR